MRAQAAEDRSRLSPTRTMAMAAAFAVHIAALLFLLAPARPAAQAQLDEPVTNVIFIDPPLPPPPPPPPPEDPPPPPEQPITPRRNTERVVEPERTTASTPDSVDISTISDEPVSDPVVPTGPPSDSFTDARADARYGSNNRVRYPTLAIKRREQGEVQLRILISRDGRPLQVELARSSGSRELDRAAKKSVMSWRFVPAERNGEKIESWAIVPILFNLDQV